MYYRQQIEKIEVIMTSLNLSFNPKVLNDLSEKLLKPDTIKPSDIFQLDILMKTLDVDLAKSQQITQKYEQLKKGEIVVLANDQDVTKLVMAILDRVKG